MTAAEFAFVRDGFGTDQLQGFPGQVGLKSGEIFERSHFRQFRAFLQIAKIEEMRGDAESAASLAAGRGGSEIELAVDDLFRVESPGQLDNRSAREKGFRAERETAIRLDTILPAEDHDAFFGHG